MGSSLKLQHSCQGRQGKCNGCYAPRFPKSNWRSCTARLSANGSGPATKVGWLRKMAQKQKTASVWAGLPCSLSTSKGSDLSAWPGEEGGGGLRAGRALLLGFQRAPSLLQRADLPAELGLSVPRMGTAQGDHSSSRKRDSSKAARLHRLLTEGNPTFLALND